MADRHQKMAAIVVGMLTAFFVGTAVPELLRMGTGTYAGFFSLYSFQKYGASTILPEKIFPYIAAVRMKTLLFLWMSSYTALGFAAHFAYIWWLASSAGMLLSLFMLRDGYEGILLFLCCLFPQWILYGAAWKTELGFLFRRRRRSLAEGLPQAAAFRRREMADFGKMIGFCGLGCAAEAFLGTWTIKIFLQYFT